MLVRKMFKATALACALFSIVFVSSAFAEDKTVLKVGDTSLTETDVLRVIANTAGGNQMMVGMILAQSSLEERKEILKQVSSALLLSEAARSKGYALRPDVAFQIKWQTIQVLLTSYLENEGSKWDMGEKAARKYYSEHLHEFVEAPATHVRQILCETKGAALNAALAVYKNNDFAKVAAEFSRDKNTAQRGGDMGWVEKGMAGAELEKAISEARIGSLVGPIETEAGWHIIEVLARRDHKQLSFDEAQGEVVQRMQMAYLEKELNRLKEKFPVSIDDQVLSNLGGMPLPAAQ